MIQDGRTREPVGRRIGRWILIACGGLAVASLANVLVVFPDGSPVSSDPGAPAIPTWIQLAPALAGIVLVLVLPWRPPAQPALPVERPRLRIATALLLLLAVLFPALTIFPGLPGESYVLAKVALFMVVPAVIVLALRNTVRIAAVRGAWRWWAPILVIAVWTLLSQLAPWNPAFDGGGYERETVIIVATATAISAGIGEELFYRRWLQTRLEALLGPWPGISVR